MSSEVPTHLKAFPDQQTELFLDGPAGRLECIVDVPEPGQARAATAVLAHPHPQHGGTMRNKVVTIMERALRESGLRTLRFNFRGTGESEGEFDDGDGELADLLAVVEWVRRVRPDDDLWLAGFSFGAWISLRAAQTLPVRMLITIAPPVERYGFTELLPPNCPWLVVQGDEDDVVSPRAVIDWAEGLDRKPQLVVMEGSGHFFHRRLMDLRGLLKNAVQAHLP
ncbi:MAG: alpha/beta hydrolase [Gammaproteobacteria bacterium HGW-Gammaproteobacteria-8]|nr:MAG: alpha/beta hydrolase [Gammaproteobacteria bacterium HGW-Gammaproteobacteria-8]